MGPITVDWAGAMAFTGRTEEGHGILMDASPAVGGEGKGPRPTELLLVALGGCTGMDVVSILKKMEQPLAALTMSLEADRAADDPKVFTAIRLVYRFRGEGLNPERLRRAIDLSLDKYCTVGNVLNKTATITYKVEVNGEALA